MPYWNLPLVPSVALLLLATSAPSAGLDLPVSGQIGRTTVAMPGVRLELEGTAPDQPLDQYLANPADASDRAFAGLIRSVRIGSVADFALNLPAKAFGRGLPAKEQYFAIYKQSLAVLQRPVLKYKIALANGVLYVVRGANSSTRIYYFVPSEGGRPLIGELPEDAFHEVLLGALLRPDNEAEPAMKTGGAKPWEIPLPALSPGAKLKMTTLATDNANAIIRTLNECSKQISQTGAFPCLHSSSRANLEKSLAPLSGAERQELLGLPLVEIQHSVVVDGGPVVTVFVIDGEKVTNFDLLKTNPGRPGETPALLNPLDRFPLNRLYQTPAFRSALVEAYKLALPNGR